MESLTIGKVARLASIGVETIRFYEREGLIAEPPRRESGYRQYPAETVSRLRFIKRAKALGFTLKEIRELLSLRAVPGTRCAEVRRRAEEKIRDIDGRIAALRGMRGSLSKLMEECEGSRPVTECPILESLDPHQEDTP